MSRDLTTKTTFSRRHSVGALVTPCNGSSSIDAAGRDGDVSALAEAGFATRFVDLEPAEEARGDLDRVIWSDVVIEAGPDIPGATRAAIDAGHAHEIEMVMRTPYPPGIVREGIGPLESFGA